MAHLTPPQGFQTGPLRRLRQTRYPRNRTEVEFVFINEPETPGGTGRQNPSPSRRYIRESEFNPVIDLYRTKHIPVVRLNRAETDSEASSEESIEVELTRDESEEELEAPEPGPETEEDTNEDHQNVYSEVDEPEEPQPEREVFIKKSKSAARNKRRRHRIKTVRDQDRKHVTERIDASHPKMRICKGATRNTRQNPRTPSAEIVSNEEVDDQDTKVPKDKKKNRHQ